MSWGARARLVGQRVGLDPRYLRRLRWVSKARSVRGVGAPLAANLEFVLLDPESTNFTYELANRDELVRWVAQVAAVPAADVEPLFAEVASDAELRSRVIGATAGHWWWTKRMPPFGKRVAWYALARLRRPELVVETGVHDGLGSLMLLRALERNRSEGASGELVSFDVNPTAGWLVGSHPQWELRIESSRSGLERALADRGEVGMFIHDSLHTYENERFELGVAAPRLTDGGLLISDNVHVSKALRDTCAEHGLRYAEFIERPLDHFYTGGLLGAGAR